MKVIIMLGNLFSNAETKLCSRCGQQKLLKEFGKNKRKQDGLQAYCKVCAAIASKNSRQKKIDAGLCRHCNSPAIASNKCIYHLVYSTQQTLAKRHNAPALGKHEVEQLIAKSNFDENGTTICPKTGQLITLGQNASLCHDKPFGLCENAKEWHSLHNLYFGSLQLNLTEMSHQCKPKGNNKQKWKKLGGHAIYNLHGHSRGGAAFGRQLQQIFESKDWVCPYLLLPLDSIDVLSLDHIIPISKGGTNSLHNLQFISREANHRKRAKSHKEFCIETIGYYVEPNYLG